MRHAGVMVWSGNDEVQPYQPVDVLGIQEVLETAGLSRPCARL